MQVQGLQTRPELNGRDCCVAAYSQETGRFVVFVAGVANPHVGDYERGNAISLRPENIRCFVARRNETPGMFEADVTHGNDFASLDEPDAYATIAWRRHARPARLQQWDNRTARVVSYNCDRGLVTIVLPSGEVLELGCGLLELEARRPLQRRRVASTNNVDPLRARELQAAAERAARQQQHGPQPTAILPRDVGQRDAIEMQDRCVLLLGGPGAGKTMTAIARLERQRHALAYPRKGVIICQTLKNTDRMKKEVRALGLAAHYDVFTRQQTLMLESDQYFVPDGWRQAARVMERGKRNDPDDEQAQKMALPYQVYATDTYFAHLWDEATEDARVYDLLDDIMRHFALQRGVAPLEADREFGGACITLSGSVFQLPAVIGAVTEDTERAVGNLHVPYDLVIDSPAIMRFNRCATT